MALIADIWDPKLAVEGSEADARARVLAAVEEPMMVCKAVAGYKRRLGADATGVALRQDKKVARQVGYQLFLVAAAAGFEHDWKELGVQVTAEQRQAAAVVKWAVWLPIEAERLRQEAVWCATWVMKMNLRSKLLRTIAYKLDEASARLVRIVGEL